VSIKLKKPSEIFKKEENISVDNVIEEVVQKKELATFSDAFESFKNNLNKIESISNFSNVLDDYKINVDKINYLSKNVEDIRIEIQNLLKKEDLNNAMMSQLLIVEQSIRDVQNKVKGINEKNLNDIRSDISNLTDNLNEFVEFEAPKYKNLIIDSEFRISSKYNKLEENTNQTITNIEKTINKKFIEIGDTLNSINDESLNEIIQDFRLLEFTFKEIKEKFLNIKIL
jgi:hypothetical protein